MKHLAIVFLAGLQLVRAAGPPPKAMAEKFLANTPLRFEQTPAGSRGFSAYSPNYRMIIEPTANVLAIRGASKGSLIRTRFLGANARARLIGEQLL